MFNQRIIAVDYFGHSDFVENLAVDQFADVADHFAAVVAGYLVADQFAGAVGHFAVAVDQVVVADQTVDVAGHFVAAVEACCLAVGQAVDVVGRSVAAVGVVDHFVVGVDFDQIGRAHV